MPDLQAKAFVQRQIEVKGGNEDRIKSRNARPTLAEIKAETVGKTLSSIESEELIHTLADTLLLRRPCIVWSARQRSKQKVKAMPH